MHRLSIYTFLVSSVLLAGISCASEPTGPEAVVTHYIEALAQYDFEVAASLSTPEQRAYLEALATVIGDDPPAADSAWVAVEAIACQIQGNTAICMTSERDAYETVEKEYWLVKRGSHWRIDRPEEDDNLEWSEE